LVLSNIDQLQVVALFNESDAAALQQDQTVEVTFDALPDVTASGHVAAVAPGGTAVSGVISYYVTVNLDETDMVAEAEVEHTTAKQLIAEIEPVGEPDEQYDAKVKVLSEYIKHHVKEEEGEIFPEVSSEEEELDELGQEMAARKAELMAEMGLEEEMPEEMPGEAGARKKRGGEQRETR
jgi:hypothetical protein